MSSVFSKIIAKEIPAQFVYEDDLVVAFLDIAQATKGHTLVVTKKEFTDIHDVPEDLAAHLFKVVAKLSKGIKTAFRANGINILGNNGAAAGQTVFHFHIHILPRYNEYDEIVIRMKNNHGNVNYVDLKERAEAIKAALL
jgi:histidine triad (HIT) family protein